MKVLEKIKVVPTSARFWELVIAAVFLTLSSYDIIPKEIAGSVILILLGSVGVETLDKGNNNKE